MTRPSKPDPLVALWHYPRPKAPQDWTVEAQDWAARSDVTIGRTYEVDAETWHDTLTALQKDVKRGAVHTVVAERVDVLAPSLPSFADLMRTLGKAGGRLVLIHNDVDTASQDPLTIFRLFEAMSRWNSQTVIARERKVRVSLGAAPRPIRVPAPFGYRWLRGRLEPDPVERRVSEQIFALYAETPNSRLVATTLIGQGESMRGRRRVYANDIRDIVRDPTSAGRFPDGATLAGGVDRWSLDNPALLPVEAIVGRPLWETCNDLMDEENLWH